MATTPIIPASFGSANLFQKGLSFVASGNVKNMAGANENISAWTSAELDLYSQIASSQGAVSPVQTITTGITLNADGTIDLVLDPSVINTIAPNGVVNASVYAKPTSGDPLQLLATGSIKFNLN